MTHFRVYCCDPEGTILKGEDVEADDLTAAIAAGRALCDPHSPIEIWQRTVMVFSDRSSGG